MNNTITCFIVVRTNFAILSDIALVSEQFLTYDLFNRIGNAFFNTCHLITPMKKLSKLSFSVIVIQNRGFTLKSNKFVIVDTGDQIVNKTVQNL